MNDLVDRICQADTRRSLYERKLEQRRARLAGPDDRFTPLRPAVVRKARPYRHIHPVIVRVASKHGVCPEEVIGKRRTRPVTAARHEAMYELRTHGLSYNAVARFFSSPDHSTVFHGVRTHAERNGLKIPGQALTASDSDA